MTKAAGAPGKIGYFGGKKNPAQPAKRGVHKPGDANVRHMTMSTWKPRGVR